MRRVGTALAVVAVLGLSAGTAVSGAAVAASKTVHYKFHKVRFHDTGSGCINIRVDAINDKGLYGGVDYCRGKTRGYIVKPGRNAPLALFHAPGGKGTDTFVVTLANNGSAAVLADQNYKPPYAAFVRSRSGYFTKVIDPKAGRAGTQINGLNSAGVAVGSYQSGGPKSASHAFVDDNGTYSDYVVDEPGVKSSYLNSINDKGEMLGGWFDKHGLAHAFLVINGKFKVVHLPGVGTKRGDGIYGASLASNGDYTGEVSRNGKGRLFVVHGNQHLTVPAPSYTQGSAATQAINRHDTIVGDYTGADKSVHGFIARRK